jgi:hypothetical protein
MRQTVGITPRDDMNVDNYDSTHAMANTIPSVGRRRSQRVRDVPAFSVVPPSPAFLGCVLDARIDGPRWVMFDDEPPADLVDRLVRCVIERRRGVKSRGLL